MRLLAIAAITLLAATTANADPPKWQNEANADTCSESFPARLADFRQSVVAQQRYMREYERVMPWFDEHCRWLSELEIAIRKIDDPAAFVCDTRKGRPKGLTSEFALDHQGPRTVENFVDDAAANTWCHLYDAASAVTLNLGYAEPPINEPRVIMEAMCWHVEGAKCDRVRAALAASE